MFLSSFEALFEAVFGPVFETLKSLIYVYIYIYIYMFLHESVQAWEREARAGWNNVGTRWTVVRIRLRVGQTRCSTATACGRSDEAWWKWMEREREERARERASEREIERARKREREREMEREEDRGRERFWNLQRIILHSQKQKTIFLKLSKAKDSYFGVSEATLFETVFEAPKNYKKY